MTLTVGSLFTGIGGIDLGLERAGMTIKWQSEIDPYCTQILAKHWPTIPNLGDIKTIDWYNVEPVDVIAGGYPCQPFSYAGNRKGTDDDRHLWPYFYDAIRILRPSYALLENVAGHVTLGFDRVLADLAAIGFDAEWSTVSACSVGAPHSRPRLFCLAYPTPNNEPHEMPDTARRRHAPQPGRSRSAQNRPNWWLPESTLVPMVNGIPRHVVAGPLAALGNAVVPQVAEHVANIILEMDAAT